MKKAFVALGKACFLPPGSLVLLGFLGSCIAAVGYPVFGVALSGVSLGGLWLLGIPVFARRLLRLLDQYEPIAGGAPRDSEVQALVILDAGGRDGARENPDLGVSALTLERLRHGAALQREWGLPVLVTGNGARRAQADVLEQCFRIPVQWVEELSDNTQENALFSARILLPEGVSRIALVTHFWHMPRAAEAFRKVGFEVVPAPMGFGKDSRGARAYFPSVAGWLDSYLAMHEGVGRLWYRLRFRPTQERRDDSKQ